METLDNIQFPAPFLRDYVPIGLLGKGGMGFVVLATEKKTSRKVAAKFLLQAVVEDETIKKRFQREAQVTLKFNHKNLVRGLAVSEDTSALYLIFEYIEGGTLAEKLRQGAFSEEEAKNMLLQIGEGLSHAHGLGILHRDLKPQNILLTKEGTPKIADFGLAAVASEAERLTRTGVLQGTPAYMAPEQILGEKVDERADLYALATIAYEMVSRKRPFKNLRMADLLKAKASRRASPLRKVMPSISTSYTRSVDKALQLKRENRHHSVAQFIGSVMASEENTLSEEETYVSEQLPTKMKLPESYTQRPNKTKTKLWPFLCLGIAVLLIFLAQHFQEEPKAPIEISQFKVEKFSRKAKISWQSNRPCKTSLIYRKASSKSEGQTLSVAPAIPSTRIHSIELKNLDRYTKYELRFLTGQSEKSLPYHFRTERSDISVSHNVGENAIILYLKNRLPGVHQYKASAKWEDTYGKKMVGDYECMTHLPFHPLKENSAYEFRIEVSTPSGNVEKIDYTARTKQRPKSKMLCMVHPDDRSHFSARREGFYAYSSPSTWQNKIFLSVYGVGLHCYDLKAKKSAWRRNHEDVKHIASLRTFDDKLYILDGVTAPRQLLQCLRCDNGKTLWQRTVPKGISRHTTCVEKAGVIFLIPGQGFICHTLQRGETKWQINDKLIRPFGLFEAKRIWAMNQDYVICAYDAHSGKKIAKTEKKVGQPLQFYCPPREGKEKLFLFTADGRMVVYPLYGKEPITSFQLGKELRYPKITGNLLIIGNYKDPAKVFAIDINDHQISWTFAPKGKKGFAKTTYLVSENKIFFETVNDTIVCLDKMSGTKLWRVPQFTHAPFELRSFGHELLFCRSTDFAFMSLSIPY